MFCTECGQAMADDAKFCAYCGTRRTVLPAGGEVPATQIPPLEPGPPSAPAPPPARAIRSTAEIMPIRMQRPSVPPTPRVTEAGPVEAEEPEMTGSAVPWPAEDSQTPPLFTAAEPPRVVERAPMRPPAPPPSAYSAPAPPLAYPATPPKATEAPAPDRYGSVPFADTQVMPETTAGKRRMSPVLIGAILVALIALAGIVWMLHSTMSGTGKPAAPVGITIYPTAVKVVPGKAVDFVAEVTGAPGSDVKWSVEEGENVGEIKTRGASAKENSISLYSTFTTPKTPGVYHLVATSTADTSKSATAEVTVAAK